MTQLPTNVLIALFPLAQPTQGKSAVMPVDGAAAEPFADAFATLLTAGQESLPQVMAASDLTQMTAPADDASAGAITLGQADGDDTESPSADDAILNLVAGVVPPPIQTAPVIIADDDQILPQQAPTTNRTATSSGQVVVPMVPDVPAGTLVAADPQAVTDANVKSGVVPIVNQAVGAFDLGESDVNTGSARQLDVDVAAELSPNSKTEPNATLTPTNNALTDAVRSMDSSESTLSSAPTSEQATDTNSVQNTFGPNAEKTGQEVKTLEIELEQGASLGAKSFEIANHPTHDAMKEAERTGARFSTQQSAKDAVTTLSPISVPEGEAVAIQELITKGDRKPAAPIASGQTDVPETALPIEGAATTTAGEAAEQQSAADQSVSTGRRPHHKARAFRDTGDIQATNSAVRSDATTNAKNAEALKQADKATNEVTATKSVESTSSGRQMNVSSHNQAALTNESAPSSAAPDTRPFTIETPKPIQVPGQVRVRIDPPELGYIRVDLTSSANGIVGTMRIRSDQTRDIIERHIGDLHKSLANAGVRVERFEIVGVSRSEAKQPFNPNTPNQNQDHGQASQRQGQPPFNTPGHHGRRRQDDAYSQPMLARHNAPQPVGVGAYSGINLFA